MCEEPGLTRLLDQRRDLVRLSGGRLTLADGQAQATFSQALALGTPVGRRAIRIGEPDLDQPHWLVVRDLPGSPGDAITKPLVFASIRMSSELVRIIDPDRLVVDLGLTATEADIAAALTEGRLVKEIASERGRTVKTVTWHLDNARGKLNCATQADLVRTVLLVSM